MISGAMKALREMQMAALAHPVVYFHRGAEGKAVCAVVGRTAFRLADDYGRAMRLVTRDFIVPATELAVEPEPGDIVNEDGREYEVLSPGGEPCWRWSDPQRTARRIHTKQIGGES